MGTAGREGFLNNYTLTHAAKAYDKALMSIFNTATDMVVSPNKKSPHIKQPNL
jgi:hypothetical protein